MRPIMTDSVEKILRFRAIGCRSAFTLLEMIVVLFVISILAGLLLPAVQAARESSRRMKCENNERQILLALQSFHSAWGHFPSSPVSMKSKFSTDPFSHHSFLVELLPYLEQGAFYSELTSIKLLNFNRAASTGLRPKFDDVSKQILQCPSDGTAVGSNYRGCTGPGLSRHGKKQMLNSPIYRGWGIGWGAFVMGSATSMNELVRGSSNTIIISEKKRGGFGRRYVEGADIWMSSLASSVGGIEYVTIELARSMAEAESGNVLTPVVSESGRFWWISDYRDSLYNHATTPNERLPSFVLSPGDGRGQFVDGGLIGATSYHPGCVVAGLADGSCRTFSDSVDPVVWSTFSLREEQ